MQSIPEGRKQRAVYSLQRLVAAELQSAGIERSVIVAVSGGIDSMVLLDALAGLRSEFGIAIRLAHVDHGLRSCSGADAAFVEARAEQYDLPVSIHRAASPPAKSNIEAWARDVRYRFFEELRCGYEAEAVVTAHHQSDQAETFLLRLLAGRLTSSARCMRSWDNRRKLLRPLLQVPKSEITAYADASGLRHIEDPSNRDISFTRNRIRTELIPHLEQSYNPKLIESVCVLAARLAEDERLLDELAAERAREMGDTPSIADFESIPSALAWRVLRMHARSSVGEPADLLGYDSFQRVLCCVNSPADRHRNIELGFGISCKVAGNGQIAFQKTKK